MLFRFKLWLVGKLLPKGYAITPLAVVGTGEFVDKVWTVSNPEEVLEAAKAAWAEYERDRKLSPRFRDVHQPALLAISLEIGE